MAIRIDCEFMVLAFAQWLVADRGGEYPRVIA
jgi:hypothetical protein